MTDENEKSSEVEEQNLVQEALDVTAETPSDEGTTPPAEESEQQGVPVPKHAALRQRAQAAEIAQARAEGELAATRRQQATDTPPPKSPLDAEIERQAAEGVDEEEMVITPKIYREQKLYEQQVANQVVAKATSEKLAVVQLASAKKAKAAHDDWQEVVLAADGLFTKGELLDIAAAGADFGEFAYTKAKAAIERDKSEAKPSTNTAPEKKPSKSEAEGKVPTQQEILTSLNVDAATEIAAKL